MKCDTERSRVTLESRSTSTSDRHSVKKSLTISKAIVADSSEGAQPSPFRTRPSQASSSGKASSSLPFRTRPSQVSSSGKASSSYSMNVTLPSHDDPTVSSASRSSGTSTCRTNLETRGEDKRQRKVVTSQTDVVFSRRRQSSIRSAHSGKSDNHPRNLVSRHRSPSLADKSPAICLLDSRHTRHTARRYSTGHKSKLSTSTYRLSSVDDDPNQQSIHYTFNNDYTSTCAIELETGTQPKNAGGKQDELGLLDKQMPTSARMTALRSMHNWKFSIFSLNRFSDWHCLLYIGEELFEHHNLVRTLSLDYMKLRKCLVCIEEWYHSKCVFHNSLHAADVAQAMHMIITEDHISSQLDHIDKFTCILSALCHDLDHPGTNQAFMSQTQHFLVRLYSDSTLERHHIAMTKAILHETQLLHHLDVDQWNHVMNTMDSLILATDMAKHKELLKKFAPLCSDTATGSPEQFEDSKTISLQIAIKCADLSNVTREWNICHQWAQRVCEEFFRQGDRMRKLKLGSEFGVMDRRATKPYVLQAEFLQMILPMYKMWDAFAHSDLSGNMLRSAQSNWEGWNAFRTVPARAKRVRAVK